MSLQSDINTWQSGYDNSGITSLSGTNYIGSILDVSGVYYQGGNIYDPSSSAAYGIYDFNWYAGQGVNSTTQEGSKYVLYSENGFSWDTDDDDDDGSYEFVTTGSLDTLYLGTAADTAASPLEATLTEFSLYSPLLVIENFDVVVDTVASNVFGVTDGNDDIDITATGTAEDGTSIDIEDLMSNPSYYESVTLNSAIIYDLAFDTSAESMQTFEWVLDQYLESIGSDITDSYTDIDTALTAAGDGVTIDYYDYTAYYGDGDADVADDVA
jgi:hypothetical protein